MACLSLGIVVQVCTTTVAAARDVFTYDTPGEQFGAATISPLGHREIVRRTTDYCAETFADIKASSRQAFVVWVRRQSAYLVLADAMRGHMRKMAEAEASRNPELAKQWRSLLDQTLPKTVQLSGRMAVMALQEGPGTPEVKRNLCLKFNANAISGALDLETWDPVNAKFLQDGLPSSPRETAPTDPMGDLGTTRGTPRLEAAAPLGRWTTARAKMYLLDGTLITPPGSCTIEYTPQRYVSECVVSGRKLRSGFSYKVIAPGRYQAELVENPGFPSAIGTRVESMFRVNGDELLIVTFPPVAPNAPEKSPIKTEAVLKREPR
jgi:hypothetical protein